MQSILKAEKKDREKDRPKGASPRVIRTFEEIKVPTVVNTEEWYEELECGICAHILGGTQAIVPCGHSFCGPCVWQWTRINKQSTCPHCRVAVSENTPFVPNIMVDQIIDRKLLALPDSLDKQAMEVERNEKIDAWRVIQASIAPTKPVQKRARGLDEIISSVLELGGGSNSQRASGHNRRASRGVMELGAPIHAQIPALLQSRPPLPHHNTITDLARLRDERYQEQLADLRRMREQRVRLTAPHREHEGTVPLNPTYAAAGLYERSLHTSSSMTPLPEPQGNPPTRNQANAQNTPRSHAPLRSNSVRSAALARRQARGQSRDDPLVVLSDEE